MGSPLDGCWIITRHRSAIWELSLGFELSFAAKTVAAIAGFFSLSTQELLLRPLRRDRQIWRNRATKARSGDDTQPVKLRYASDAGGQDAADRNAVLVPLFLARPAREYLTASGTDGRKDQLEASASRADTRRRAHELAERPFDTRPPRR